MTDVELMNTILQVISYVVIPIVIGINTKLKSMCKQINNLRKQIKYLHVKFDNHIRGK